MTELAVAPLQRLYLQLKEKNLQWSPKNLENLWFGVNTLMEDRNLTTHSDYDTLKGIYQKIITNWKFYDKEWSADTYEKLLDKLSVTLANTLATCISQEMKNSVQECFDDFLNSQSVILEKCSSGSMKETTSTSSMIVPTLMDSAGATSSEPKTFDEIFERQCEDTGISPKWMNSTGRTLSYTSLCKNGKAIHKFGLEEDYKDLRIVMKVYDGRICKENPDRYWLGKIKEMDVTCNSKSDTAKTVEGLFIREHRRLGKRGATMKTIEERGNYQRKDPNLSGYRRRYIPY
ncbi:NS2 [Solenopsis invicta densovirus]|uniref:NS2 n=1 Tax=Solenopsis invicta densovirus TaxID=1414671 RepID=U5TQZ7_9VIRU|nr:NS2 [Solenopsis invicta densovirus]AGZ03693.1 NS2 [Solenopsis invicta densovirus]